jgi:hypothetical protein
MFPFQTYGNWAWHIVVSVVLVTAGITVRFSMAMESQPAALVKVTGYEPLSEYEFPFQTYGSCAWQMVISVMLETDGLTVRFRVAMESQPTALVKVTGYEPLSVYRFPFQTYGNCAGQMVISAVLETNGLTVRFSVAMESHPAALIKVTGYEPLSVYVFPFQT